MEDLIVLALFILASLASYISKLRESKRQDKRNIDEGHSPEDAGWPDVSLEPDFEPIKPRPPSSEPQIEKAWSGSRKPEKHQHPLESTIDAPDIIEKILPIHQRVKTDDSLTKSAPAPTYTANVGYVEKKFGHYEFSSTSKLKKHNYVRINIKSKSSFQKAILTREILDRPRAYDI